MKSKRPILVTGSHASGTTWVGRMIAYAPRVAYLYEPFKTGMDRTICKADFPYWFPYVCIENEAAFIFPVQDMLNYRARFSQGIETARTVKQYARQVRTLFQFANFRLLNFRPLIKDPIAVFSTEWLAERFDAIPIILIRHPAAFAGSLKNNNWADHPFDHFTAQPLLIRDYLSPFSKEIELFTREKQDVIDQAALLWKMIHHVISVYREKHPDWLFIRHEDISRDPVNQYRMIFNKLEIPFTIQVEENIKRYSETENKRALISNRFSALRRNSTQNVKSWKNRLTQAEIERVREKVQEVSELFYLNEEW